MDEDEDDVMRLQPEERIYTSDERMDLTIDGTQIACIEYPGIVHNAEKALDTLGGLKAVNRSIKDETKRLELRFRPGDTYCKPACGTHQQTAGLVLRVRRRRRQKQADEEDVSLETSPPDTLGPTGDDGGGGSRGGGDGYEYQVDIMGALSSTIKFEGMCDFQFLPVARKADGSYENLHDTLVMSSFTPEEDYMERRAPLFLSPIIFSRFDTPQDYGFLLKKRRKDTTTAMQPSEILAAGRKTRQRFTTVVSFTDPTPPGASQECLAHAAKFNDTGLAEALQELFEERPVWSRTALAYRLRHNSQSVHHLKDVLPSVAYFMLGGPWRTFWIRMGFDPRRDPSSKKFQGVDFRRQRGPEETPKVYGVGKKKDFHRKKDTASEINVNLLREADSPQVTTGKEPKLRDFEFHADVLPPYRQVVYMVCDIFDAEVQALVSKNNGKEKKCDERNGWCEPGFADRCRSVMNRHVGKLCPSQLPPNTKYQKRRKRQATRAKQLSAAEDEVVSMDTEVLEEEEAAATPSSSQNSTR